MERGSARRDFLQNRSFAKRENHWQKIEQIISTFYAGFFVDNEEEKKANRRKNRVEHRQIFKGTWGIILRVTSGFY